MINKLCERIYSRWLIFMIDQTLIFWAMSMSILMTHKIDYISIFKNNFLFYLGIYSAISAVIFTLKKIHIGMIRFSNTEDILRVFSATLICSIIYWILVPSILNEHPGTNEDLLKKSILLNFFISSSLLAILRLGVKNIFNILKNDSSVSARTILIYGAGKSSVLIKQTLENHPTINYKIVGFIDNDLDRVGKQIEQIKVYNFYAISDLKEKHNVAEMVIVSTDLSRYASRQAMEECMELGIKVSTVPPADQWLNGQLKQNQIKDLKIEDLLQREPIVLKKKNVIQEISGKRILITGAAGSIGSEIVRQVLSYHPASVILVDQAETPLHDLQLELEDKQQTSKIKLCMANIQNHRSMYTIFKNYRPQIVFHAAAYKHVPMMENNPSEAIFANVHGTKTVADLAVEFGAEKFVMISTDKAVKPTNVMGASKRLAEIYIQSLNKKLSNAPQDEEDDNLIQFDHGIGGTRFITTRFGNVLGSNGSVLPRFKAQIERGGPVTVTHPEITRYFMTIPESVQLVLEAAAMGQGGEIFIFDMGEPVKIDELARNMIRLSGLTPGKDIQIEYSGLRPGEKLYEELLNKQETTIPTYHHKIKISSVIEYPYEFVTENINELLEINMYGSETDLVRKMKEIVPEYRSNNSRFEELDKILHAFG
jgi:FlaA1/EpsC-like NDP-sugar epimerase